MGIRPRRGVVPVTGINEPVLCTTKVKSRLRRPRGEAAAGGDDGRRVKSRRAQHPGPGKQSH